MQACCGFTHKRCNCAVTSSVSALHGSAYVEATYVAQHASSCLSDVRLWCRVMPNEYPVSPQATSEGPPGTPGTPHGTSVSSINSDLPAAIQATIAQFKRELPEVPLDILQHIGSGGYGNVYRGIWKGLEVAIKTIVFQDRLQDSTAEQVFKEAAIACNMSNAHVVNTFTHELKRMPVQVPGELADFKLYIIQVCLPSYRP
jgi:serine/threonine protein kinase